MIISYIVAVSIDLNFSNFTLGGIMRWSMGPYLGIFGNIFWGIMFGFIGGAIYANERSLGTTAAYLILVGAFTSFIFPGALVALFGILLTFIVSVILYITFIQVRE